MSWLGAAFLLLIPFAALAWRSQRWAVLCLLSLLPTYLWRTSIFGLPTTWFELALYITVLISVIQLGLKPWRELFKKTNWRRLAPIALWVLAAVVSTLVAPDKRLALGILKGWIIDPLLFVGLLAVVTHRDTQLKQFWQEAIFMLLVGAAATTLIALAHAGAVDFSQRLAGWYDSPNVFAMYLTPIAVAALAWIFGEGKREVRPGWKWVWVVLSAIVALGIMLTGSYAALGSLVLGLVAYAAFYRARTYQLAQAVGILLITVGLLMPWLSVAGGRFPLPSHQNAAQHLASGDIRLILWREATSMLVAHPIVGLGLGQWQPRFMELLRPGLAGALNPAYLVELYYASLFPHNLWLTTWLSLGMLGLIALAWLVMLAFRTGAALPAAVLTALLLHGVVDTPVFKNDLSVLFWVWVVASLTWTRKSAAT